VLGCVLCVGEMQRECERERIVLVSRRARTVLKCVLCVWVRETERERARAHVRATETEREDERAKERDGERARECVWGGGVGGGREGVGIAHHARCIFRSQNAQGGCQVVCVSGGENAHESTRQRQRQKQRAWERERGTACICEFAWELDERFCVCVCVCVSFFGSVFQMYDFAHAQTG